MNASPDSPAPVRKFNPGTLQSDEDVTRQFVVRQAQLEIVLEVLRGNVDSPSCQHVLIVAPRGRGKTMLLARIAAELRTDGALAERLLPVRFMEESQEVFTPADFWLDTLFHLAREIRQCDPQVARELQEAHAELAAGWRGDDLAERVQATVLEAADRLGRKLVLMVENLQALCDSVDDDFGWKLREVLQSEPQIILLATATSRFTGLDDAREPFFELFRILRLEPLDTGECRRLWQAVSGDRVGEREIRPLEILTGGDPRLLVIVAGFARHGSLRQLMEELVTLIDDHTEYFRAHLEGFAKTERRVYLAVLDLWQSSSTGEIAARARMDVRPVSTLLGRLAERGAVVVEGSGRKRRYGAAQRLYSIYYKLRRERDEAAVVQGLIHFMAMFYTEDELAKMSSQLMVEAALSPAIHEGLRWARAEAPEVRRAFSGKSWRWMEDLFGQGEALDDEAAEQLLDEIRVAGDEGAFERVIEIADRYLAGDNGESSRLRDSVVARMLNARAVACARLDRPEEAAATWERIIERFGGSDAPNVLVPVAKAWASRGALHAEFGEYDAAVTVCDEVVGRFGDSDVPEIQGTVATALADKAAALEWLGQIEAATATFDEVLERFGDNDASEVQAPVAWALLSKVLAPRLFDDAHAKIAACDALIERFDASRAPEVQFPVAMAWANKAFALGQLGKTEAAIATCDEVVKRFGAGGPQEVQLPIAMALNCRAGMHLILDNISEAAATWDRIIERFGDSNAPELSEQIVLASFNKGLAQGQPGDLEKVMAIYDRTLERLGGDAANRYRLSIATLLAGIGVMQEQSGEPDAAIAICDELERVADSLPDDKKVEPRCLGEWVRTRALLRLRRYSDAMDTFRSIYAAFVPTNETMMRWMVAGVPELVSAGAPERDLLDVLPGNAENAAALAPLIVALRQRVGEAVRAPPEMLDVAADIRKRIEEGTGQGL